MAEARAESRDLPRSVLEVLFILGLAVGCISGVIGGVAAFGVVGLFIGPVMLAVASALLEGWMAEDGGGA